MFSSKEFDILALCKAADKYQLDPLMDLITGNLTAFGLETIKLKPGDLADVFIAAEMFNKKKMYEIAMKELKMNKGILKDNEFEEKVKEWPDLLYKITVSISTND